MSRMPVDSLNTPAVSPVAAAPLPAIAPDTVAADTIVVTEKVFGLTLDPPVEPKVEPMPSSFGMSCVFSALFILFCVIGLRFRNNLKYVTTLLHNLVEVRVRHNVFDETVRETSFLVLLNLLWCCSAGIILCRFLRYTLPPPDSSSSFGIPALTTHPALCMALCMGIAVVYTCFMALAYLTVGNVFSDRVRARMWLKGFAASQGVLSALWLPLSLLLIFYPEWSEQLFWIALVTFLLAKIVFIWKGFRIFFTRFSSWVLFLYYLCSLEIVPLILTYWAALFLCSLI